MRAKRRIGQGVLVALLGAFVWALWWVDGEYRNETLWWMFWAGYFVLVASWFVVPMGAALGAVLPGMVAGGTVGKAVVRGAAMGVAAAVLAASGATLILHLGYFTGTALHNDDYGKYVWNQFVEMVVSMGIVCVTVVGIWAGWLAREVKVRKLGTGV